MFNLSDKKEITINITASEEDRVIIGATQEKVVSLSLEQENVDVNMSEEENVDVNIELKEIMNTKDHSKLDNLDFENSGHTGFASEKDLQNAKKEIQGSIPKKVSQLEIDVELGVNEEKVLDIIEKNGEETSELGISQTKELELESTNEIDIATSENYDEESDNQLVTPKLTTKLIDEKAVPKRLTILPNVDSSFNRKNIYLYADENGTSKRISMKNLLDKKMRTVNSIPSDLQEGEYIFLEINN